MLVAVLWQTNLLLLPWMKKIGSLRSSQSNIMLIGKGGELSVLTFNKFVMFMHYGRITRSYIKSIAKYTDVGFQLDSVGPFNCLT